MKTIDRVDPECRDGLLAYLEVVPGGLASISDIVARREAHRALLEAVERPSQEAVDIESHIVRGANQSSDIEVRIYRPRNASEQLPVLAYIHGGGMCSGNLDSEEFKCLSLSEELNAVVVSLDYRKAPEHPYPAASEDCYTGLQWIVENAESLNIDKDNLGVCGGSAGGGLAIAVALMARDRGEPSLKYVMSLYPMLDDRNESSSSCEILNLGVWDRAANVEAWRWYLNGQMPNEYAAPARALSLQGLPPMFIDVGEVDLFRDEAVDFASRLMRAQVLTELHVYAGAYHGSEVLAPEAALSKRIIATRVDALRRFMKQ